MNKAYLIFWHELRTLLGSSSYRILVLFPLLLSLAITAGPIIRQVLNPADSLPADSNPTDLVEMFSLVFRIPKLAQPQGYVDAAGLVTQYPPDLDRRLLLKYPSEAEARQAMRIGQIASYYLIPENYLSLGVVMKFVPARDSAWMGLSDNDLDVLLDYNLVYADDSRLDVIKKPILTLQETNLSPQQERSMFDPDDPTQIRVSATPYFVAAFLWFIISVPSLLLGNGLNRESENRVMEILVSSAGTDEIVLGKFAGQGAGGLLFLLSIFAAAALYILPVGRYVIAGMQRLSPATLAWSAVFAMGSYLLYGLILMTFGLLSPNLESSSLLSPFILLPCLIPVFLYQFILDRPHDPIAIGLSLFPLTSPTTILMRLMAADVPSWQLIVAFLLLFAFMAGVVKIASVVVRTKSLLTGFSIQHFLKTQWGRLTHH